MRRERLRRPLSKGSNLSAALRAAMTILALVMLCGVTANAQDSAVPTAQQDEHPAADTVKFLGGAALGLAMHESGHLIFDVILDTNPHLKGIHFGPFPFFALTHDSGQSPREEFTISSAGFWVQEATNEWLLSRRWCRDAPTPCTLRDDHAWVAKGVFAFNVLNSVGYSIVAFAKAGPPERDTRGMATIGVDERVIGVIVLAPAVLDAYRYFRPHSRTAAWLSRGVKVGSVLLVLK